MCFVVLVQAILRAKHYKEENAIVGFMGTFDQSWVMSLLWSVPAAVCREILPLTVLGCDCDANWGILRQVTRSAGEAVREDGWMDGWTLT